MRAGIIALSILLAGSAPVLAQSRSQPSPADGFTWRDAPAALPKGAQMAVVSGNPAKKGPFVVRLKLPPGYVIPPHRHAMAENVTVLYGTLNLGMGEKLDRTRTTQYARGDHFSIPANKPHYALAGSQTVIQLNGTGPYAIDYVDPANDPTKLPPAPAQ
jgi:quercetin dioxygenase-like cupin family protein